MVLLSTTDLTEASIYSSVLCFSPVPVQPEQSIPLLSALTCSISCCTGHSQSKESQARWFAGDLLRYSMLFQKWLKSKSENASLKLIRMILLCYITVQTFQSHHPIIFPFRDSWHCYILLPKKRLEVHLLTKQL